MCVLLVISSLGSPASWFCCPSKISAHLPLPRGLPSLRCFPRGSPPSCLYANVLFLWAVRSLATEVEWAEVQECKGRAGWAWFGHHGCPGVLTRPRRQSQVLLLHPHSPPAASSPPSPGEDGQELEISAGVVQYSSQLLGGQLSEWASGLRRRPSRPTCDRVAWTAPEPKGRDGAVPPLLCGRTAGVSRPTPHTKTCGVTTL